MAFWGVEVKPGKPYTHQYDDTHGRLHISQATLDYGPSMKKSVVQCNVGNKTPVLLCSLLPDKIESCPLNLEFEEADEVIFSVLGPKSVHLTGYYLGLSRRYNQDGDDTDSYGEDIADTETDRSNETEDEYEDDFIDDGDPEVFLPLPQLRSSGEPTNKSGTRRRLKKKYQASDSEGDNGDHAKVFGKHTSIVVLESEDEDCIPLSAIWRSEQNIRNEKEEDKLDNNSAGEVRKNKKGEDDGDQGMLLKRKIDAIEQDGNREREANQTCGSLVSASEFVAENGLKSKKKKKERAMEEKILESGVSLSTDKTKERASREQNQAMDDSQINIPNDSKDWSLEVNIDNMDQDLPIRGDLKEKLPGNEKAIDSVPSDVVIIEFNGRPNKQKNESAKKDTALKQEVDPSSETVDKASYDNGKPSHIMEEAKSEMIDQNMFVRAQESSAKLPDDKKAIDSVPSDVVIIEFNGRPKKKKNESAKDTALRQVVDPSSETVDKASYDNGEPSHIMEEAKSEMIDQNMSVRAQESSAKLPDDKKTIDSVPADVVIVEFNGRPKKKKNESAKDTALKQEVDPSSETVDRASYDNGKPSHIMEEAKSEMIDQNMSVRVQESSAKLPDDNQNEGKKKKKKRKSKESDTNINKEGFGLPMMDEKNEYAKEIETSDGLVIEELSMGNPDGKRASHGNKVSIYYTGRLNEKGKVFDSNIGQKPFKFRLGKGRVIEGWDVGIPGMRIGDKRRLIIPPSFGYGPEGAGEVPGNAWLIYDVELVDVR